MLITFQNFSSLFNIFGKRVEKFWKVLVRPAILSTRQTKKERTMSEDFYPFVDSGDPAPDNYHLTGTAEDALRTQEHPEQPARTAYTTRISVYDDMLSTPRVIVVEQTDVRTYLEDVTNTVHRTMKEQGGHLSLMIIRELVENFIHAQFSEPVISILDDGDTIRFADQGPGINDKERAFEFGVTSADRTKKRYIRGTGAGLPMVQQYIEAAGGAISVEDNLVAGTVVTVSVNPQRVAEIEHAVSRGAAVRSGHKATPEAQTMGLGVEMAHAQQAAMPHGTVMGVEAGEVAEVWGPQQGMPSQPGAPLSEGSAAYQGAPAPFGMPAHQGVPQQPGMPGPQGQQQPYYPQAYPWQAAPGAAWPPAGNPYAPGGTYGQGAYGAAAGQPAGMGAAWAAGPWGPETTHAYPGMQPAGGTGYPTPDQSGGAQVAAPVGAVPAYPTAAAAPAGVPAPSMPHISERGELALRFIAGNGKGGPTDLTRAYGNSDATWSRELDALAGTGLIYKRGQKYVLTDMGRAWGTMNQA